MPRPTLLKSVYDKVSHNNTIYEIIELWEAKRITPIVKEGKAWLIIDYVEGTHPCGFPVATSLAKKLLEWREKELAGLTDAEKVGLTSRRVYNANLNFMAKHIESGAASIVERGIVRRETAIQLALSVKGYVAMDNNKWAVYTIDETKVVA